MELSLEELVVAHSALNSYRTGLRNAIESAPSLELVQSRAKLASAESAQEKVAEQIRQRAGAYR